MFTKLYILSKNWLSKANNENEFAKLIVWAFGLLIFVIIIGIIIIILDINASSSSNLMSKAGTFGDFIGGTLNPILSFLTFMGLLVTIILQSKELEQTRQELQRSAQAQEQTEETLKKQTENLEKQKFENTFFSLLNQHNELLKELNQPDLTKTNKRPIIKTINFIIFSKPSLEEAKQELENHNQQCGHYYRVLYQILKFIATEHPTSRIRKNKEYMATDLTTETNDIEKFYSNIVRSFLNNDIIQVLAANCFCSSQEDTYYIYKLLVERYSFFEHMPFEKGFDALEQAKNHYSERAFGNSTYI